jgi:hypothetical protein
LNYKTIEYESIHLFFKKWILVLLWLTIGCQSGTGCFLVLTK